MGFWELFLLSVGLAMDAFAVSVCKGLAMRRVTFKKAAVCGVWFGSFQALMPMIGYLLGSRFELYIQSIAPRIAFILLAIIGINMIREAMEKDEDETSASLDVKTMFLMAVATSIDALAVGITFACVPVTMLATSELLNTVAAVGIIGIITFALSCVGTKIGSIFGSKYRSRAELFGGAILILIGLKILLEHLL